VEHEVCLRDPRLAKLVSRLQDLPGQELFGYLDSEGTVHDVTSGDVNAYLREKTGEDFTAKDFRTWAATTLALAQIEASSGLQTKRERKRFASEVIKSVAQRLGNTPAICRKCYIHPEVIAAIEEGRKPVLSVARDDAW
jgi:DNA topoisomerase-1